MNKHLRSLVFLLAANMWRSLFLLLATIIFALLAWDVSVISEPTPMENYPQRGIER